MSHNQNRTRNLWRFELFQSPSHQKKAGTQFFWLCDMNLFSNIEPISWYTAFKSMATVMPRYLPSRRISPPCGRYQMIMFDNRGACVNNLPRVIKSSRTSSNTRPFDRKSDVMIHHLDRHTLYIILCQLVIIMYHNLVTVCWQAANMETKYHGVKRTCKARRSALDLRSKLSAVTSVPPLSHHVNTAHL